MDLIFAEFFQKLHYFSGVLLNECLAVPYKVCPNSANAFLVEFVEPTTFFPSVLLVLLKHLKFSGLREPVVPASLQFVCDHADD